LKRPGTTVLVVVLALGILGETLAAMPGPLPAKRQPVDLQASAYLMWTPLAVVEIGALPELSMLEVGSPPGIYGPTYLVKAPVDGVVDYLYPWAGFFRSGQPLVRIYDGKLLADLYQARTLARRFQAHPYLLFGRRPRLRQPSAVAGAPELSRQPARRSAALEQATEGPTLSSMPGVSGLRRELAVAQQRLAEIEEELAARRRLQAAGVLADAEVARFEASKKEAETAVEIVQRKLKARQTTAPSPAEPPAEVSSAATPELATAVVLPPIPPAPPQLERLSSPRWEDVFAPTGGLVLRRLQPPGAVVKQGTPLLEIANSAWARVRALTESQIAARFDRATPVTITFPQFLDATFVGWVADKRPLPGDDRAQVELLVTCPGQRQMTQARLLSLAYSSPPIYSLEEVDLLPRVLRLPQARPLAERVFGLIPPDIMAGSLAGSEPEQQDCLVGRLVLVPPMQQLNPEASPAPEQQERLQELHAWQDSFIEGMATAIYDRKLVLSYPAQGEISRAVERMIRGQVRHDPGLCAATLRQALGWGLGDAYQWALKLPERGYQVREDGLPRPGDILVWPFTYGPSSSQHVGIAVEQSGKLMLLSNLQGRLGTSQILGGYLAFHRPPPQKPGPAPSS